jgi:uncharacterized membrane protein
VLRVRPGRVAYYRNGRLPALTEAELRREMQQEQEIVGMQERDARRAAVQAMQRPGYDLTFTPAQIAALF